MKPKPQPHDAFELFQAHFDQMLAPRHELVVLSKKIDWSATDAAFADCYCPDIGAPAKAIRLMVGLHYLKYTLNESDESLVARWCATPATLDATLCDRYGAVEKRAEDAARKDSARPSEVGTCQAARFSSTIGRCLRPS